MSQKERSSDIPVQAGDDTVIVGPLPVDDDITPRVLAGGPQIDDETYAVTGADLDAVAVFAARQAGLHDGIMLTAYWLARHHARAETIATEYGYTLADLADELATARILR